jgi:hypothetical protein
MGSSRYIRLETESGAWSSCAPRDEDSIFSQIIPDLPDLPDTLVLTGSVAEILEEEWNAYGRLQDYVMKAVSTRYTNGRRPADNEADLPTPVQLHEVSRIVQLLRTTDNWEKWVHVTQKTPQYQRLRHILDMGKQVYEDGLYQHEIDFYIAHDPLSGDTRHRVLLSQSPYVAIFSILSYVKDYVSDEDVMRHVCYAICGTIHNAIIRRSRGIGIELEDVEFGDLLPLLAPLLPKDVDISSYIERITSMCNVVK